MLRYVAICEYNGAHFHGWQLQKHKPDQWSVQSTVECALSYVANEAVNVVCAGRTDAGVHATMQVFHFDSHAVRSASNWLKGVNSRLPNSVRLCWVKQISVDFHARFSACARCYRYLIDNRNVRSALLYDQLTSFVYPLDHQRMHDAAQVLIGTHDFSAFQAAGCQANSPIKTIEYIYVRRWQNVLVLEVKANAFLYHMVRNIVGVLLEIGQFKRSVAWCLEVLKTRQRKEASMTAPAQGLYLVGIEYPKLFDIPSQVSGPVWVEPFMESVL